MGGAVPHAVKLQEEFGSELQVVFVEAQSATHEQMEAFALKYKWLGNDAVWTKERPFDSGLEGLPSFVLVGADGTVLEKGRSSTSKTAEAIENEIAAARKPPADAPKELHKAWKHFQKGEVAKALSEARKRGEDEGLRDAAETAVATFEAHTGARLGRVEWCIENGYMVEARAQLDDLGRDLKGAGELERRQAELDSRLQSADLAGEREAAAALERVLVRLHADGFDKKGKLAHQLEKLVEEHAGTKAAERARHLLSLNV